MPLSFSALVGVNPIEFLDELFIPKTRILGLSVTDFVTLACVALTQCQIDGRTEGRTDGQTYNPIVAIIQGSA